LSLQNTHKFDKIHVFYGLALTKFCEKPFKDSLKRGALKD